MRCSAISGRKEKAQIQKDAALLSRHNEQKTTTSLSSMFPAADATPTYGLQMIFALFCAGNLASIPKMMSRKTLRVKWVGTRREEDWIGKLLLSLHPLRRRALLLLQLLCLRYFEPYVLSLHLCQRRGSLLDASNPTISNLLSKANQHGSDDSDSSDGGEDWD